MVESNGERGRNKEEAKNKQDTGVKDSRVKEFKTVGEASEALAKRDHGTHTVHEQGKILLKNIETSLEECINKNSSLFREYFYVVKHTRRDGMMQNVSVNKYMARQTCPPPAFNQTVWKHHKAGKTEELWVLPSEFDCIELYANQDLSFEWEWPLLKYVIKYWDGALTHLSEEENKKTEKL